MRPFMTDTWQNTQRGQTMIGTRSVRYRLTWLSSLILYCNLWGSWQTALDFTEQMCLNQRKLSSGREKFDFSKKVELLIVELLTLEMFWQSPITQTQGA